MVRVKRRYVLLKINAVDQKWNKFSEIPIDDKQIMAAIRNKIHDLHGDFGLGSVLMSLNVKKFDKRTHVALISCRREPSKLLMTSLPLINKIGPIYCTIQMLKFSGTIRSSLRFLADFYEKENEAVKIK